ncbi:hypothetical protein GCM10007918_56720 [Piscinibacter gummiphilus]|nr:hypothetical protein GCM10007918_56720 [Piscinibacter gummiphilus]
MRWVGLEMALDGGRAVVTDETVVTGLAGDSPVVWAHPDVPFWQFSGVYIERGDGLHFRLFAEDADDRPNGLLLARTEGVPEPVEEAPGSLYRTRVLEHLPTGVARLSVLRQGPGGAVLDASLEISGQVIRLLCGEMYLREDGSFEMVSPNESVLVQLNGMRPDCAG